MSEGGTRRDVRTCPICSSEDGEVLLQWREEYDISRCGDCQLIFTDPMPTEEQLLEYYQGFYFKVPPQHLIDKVIRSRKEELQTLFDFPSGAERSEKSFLDFGGGNGLAAAAAVELGLSAWYHDIDESVIEYVTDHVDIEEDRVISDLSALGSTRFDYIFSDNVIEHVPDAIAFVETMYDLLEDGGELVIKTPRASNLDFVFFPLVNIGKYLAKAVEYNGILKGVKGYFRRFWHTDPPRHVYAFSRSSLKQIAEEVGAGDFEVSYYHIPLFANSVSDVFFRPRVDESLSRYLLVRLVAVPVVILELPFKMIQAFLRQIGLLSPGGIILTMTKVS